MLETDNYEKFKRDILQLAKIDLNAYKEKQMRRRINTLITKNNIKTYDEYVALIKKDKDKFEQFINFLTINVSEFYRNPDQWKILEGKFSHNSLRSSVRTSKSGVRHARPETSHIRLLWHYQDRCRLQTSKSLQPISTSRCLIPHGWDFTMRRVLHPFRRI